MIRENEEKRLRGVWGPDIREEKLSIYTQLMETAPLVLEKELKIQCSLFIFKKGRSVASHRAQGTFSSVFEIKKQKYEKHKQNLMKFIKLQCDQVGMRTGKEMTQQLMAVKQPWDLSSNPGTHRVERELQGHTCFHPRQTSKQINKCDNYQWNDPFTRCLQQQCLQF